MAIERENVMAQDHQRKTLASAVVAAATLAFVLAPGAASAHGPAGSGGHKAAYDPAQVRERSFGREGDPKKATRTIALDMSDAMRFTPDTVTLRRGETVRFVVANRGQVMHEMVLGTEEELKKHAELMKKHPGMEHEDANMAHVKPGEKGEIVWQFTQAGEYRFACLLPGHFEAGMVGKVVVR